MIIYKTTNLINGRFYVGKNKTNDPNYLGSGKILKQAIKKYGKENFKKEILEICNSEDELNERERFWIKELNCRENSLCYNIGEGGIGGDNITYNPNKNQFLEKMILINSGENNGMYGKKHKDESKNLQRSRAKNRYSIEWFTERFGLEDGTKRYNLRCVKISKSNTGSNNGEYQHVDEHDLLSIAIQPHMKLKDVCKYFNVGSTCIYGKLKLYWGCKNLKELRNKFNQ